MKKNMTYNVVLTGLLVAVGILLPFVTAHSIGVQGTVLLPMHLPVYLIGTLCGPSYGAVGGIVVPVLSSLMTGMPMAFPMLPIMMGELFTYGLVSGWLYRKTRLSIYPSLLVAMFCGRVVYGLIYAILFTANAGTLRAASVVSAFIQGIPGIVIQFILIPSTIALVGRYQRRSEYTSPKPEDVVALGRNLLERERVSCVVINNDAIVYKADGRGIKPLLDLIAMQPELLREAIVVDKIIGKAAAMLLVRSNVSRAYGEVMSDSAYEYLTAHGVRAEYGTCIGVIGNRSGDGVCPMELAVRGIDDPDVAYNVLRETVNRLAGA